MGHADNGLAQVGFRGRRDDGSETVATWLAATNVNWEQRPDRNFRVRLLVDHDGDTFGGSLFLYYALNSESFLEVTAGSSVVKAVPTIHYTSGDDSTQQIGSGTFVVDNNGMAETDAITGSITMEGIVETEAEFCIQIIGDDVSDRDIIKLRGQFGGSEFIRGYFEVPEITVDVPRTIRRTIIIE